MKSCGVSENGVFCPAPAAKEEDAKHLSSQQQKQENSKLKDAFRQHIGRDCWKGWQAFFFFCLFYLCSFFLRLCNPSFKSSSSILVQHQDTCPGHPGCHISLTLMAASTASLVSPGMLAPGRGACMCV